MDLMSFTSCYTLAPGQQVWVLEQVREVGVEVAHALTVEAADEGLAVVRRSHEVEHAYYRDRGTPHDSGDAKAVDTQIDGVVKAIHKGIEGRAQLGREHPMGRRCSDMLDDLFPEGLGAHTRARFTVQATHNARLVRQLRSPRYADACRDLGLEDLVAELERLSAIFRRIVLPGASTSYDAYAAAMATGQEAMLRAIFRIAGSFDTEKPDEVALRERILRPWRAMNERIRLERRRAESAESPEAQTAPPAPPAEASVQPAPVVRLAAVADAAADAAAGTETASASTSDTAT